LNTSPSAESVFLSLNWAKYLHSGEWYSLITKATSVLKKETRLSASHQVGGGLNQTNVYETGRAFSTMALQCANMCMLHSVLTMSNKHHMTHVLAGTASTERNGTPDYKQHETLFRNRWRDVKKDVIQPMLNSVQNEQTAICDRLLGGGGDLGGQSGGPISGHVQTFLHASMQVVSLTMLCTMAESENMKAHFEDAPHSFERSSSSSQDKHSLLVQGTRPLLKHLIEFLFEWDHIFSLFHQLHWQGEGNHHEGGHSVPGSSVSPQRSAEDVPLVGFDFQIVCTPDSFALHDTWNEGDSLATTKDFSVCTFSAGKYTDATKPVWSERFGVQYRSYELEGKDGEASSDDARLMSTEEGSNKDMAVVAKMKALRTFVDTEHHVFAQLFEVMLSLLEESGTLSSGEERVESRTSVSKLFHKGKQRPSEFSAISAEKDSQLYRYQRDFFEIILDELIRKMQQTATNSKRKASVKATARTSTVRESGQSSATTASNNGSGDSQRRGSVTSHHVSPEKKRTTGDEHRKGKLQSASVSTLNLHAIKFVSQAIEYCAKAGAASVIRNRKFLEVLLRTSKTFFFALDGAFWDPRQGYGTMSRLVTGKEFSITTTATSVMSFAEDTLETEQKNHSTSEHQYKHEDERLQNTPASTLPVLGLFPLHHRDVKNGGFIHSCLTMRSIVLELARLLVRSNVTMAKSAPSPVEAPTDLASSLGMSARALLPSLDGKRHSAGSSNVEASKKLGDSSSNISENVRFLISAEIPDSFMEARILLRTLQDTCLSDPFAIIQILNCLETMVEGAQHNEPQV
jgi:hypothetical protein